jgi:hypothetical protein
MTGMQCNVELGTNSAFALGPRKTTENLDQVGRPQDLQAEARLTIFKNSDRTAKKTQVFAITNIN